MSSRLAETLSPNDVAGATVHEYSKPFKWAMKLPPFPSDPHYDAKAWEYCRTTRDPVACCFGMLRTGTALTWLTDNGVIGRIRQSRRSDNFHQRM